MEQSLLNPAVVGKDRFDLRGYAYLAGLVLTWVAQSEVCQLVQVEHYNKPMAIAWFNHSLGVLVFPLTLLSGGSAAESRARLREAMPGGLLVWNALWLSCVFLLADWLWYVGLPRTSVAAGTTIFNTSSCWVAVVLWLLGEPQCSAQHVLAMLATMLGVCVVSRDSGSDKASLDPGSSGEQMVGNAFVLLSAMGYAVYEVFFERVLKVDGLDVLTTNLFLSLVSAANLALLWPATLLLGIGDAPGPLAEVPELPPGAALPGLCVNAALATTFNLFLGLALVRTSPLLTAVACALTIPTALAVDSVFHGDSFDATELAGSALIVGGFLALATAKARAE